VIVNSAKPARAVALLQYGDHDKWLASVLYVGNNQNLCKVQQTVCSSDVPANVARASKREGFDQQRCLLDGCSAAHIQK